MPRGKLRKRKMKPPLGLHCPPSQWTSAEGEKLHFEFDNNDKDWHDLLPYTPSAAEESAILGTIKAFETDSDDPYLDTSIDIFHSCMTDLSQTLKVVSDTAEPMPLSVHCIAHQSSCASFMNDSITSISSDEADAIELEAEASEPVYGNLSSNGAYRRNIPRAESKSVKFSTPKNSSDDAQSDERTGLNRCGKEVSTKSILKPPSDCACTDQRYWLARAVFLARRSALWRAHFTDLPECWEDLDDALDKSTSALMAAAANAVRRLTTVKTHSRKFPIVVENGSFRFLSLDDARFTFHWPSDPPGGAVVFGTFCRSYQSTFGHSTLDYRHQIAGRMLVLVWQRHLELRQHAFASCHYHGLVPEWDMYGTEKDNIYYFSFANCAVQLVCGNLSELYLYHLHAGMLRSDDKFSVSWSKPLRLDDKIQRAEAIRMIMTTIFHLQSMWITGKQFWRPFDYDSDTVDQ